MAPAGAFFVGVRGYDPLLHRRFFCRRESFFPTLCDAQQLFGDVIPSYIADITTD